MASRIARHPQIDGIKIGVSDVILAMVTVNAETNMEAVAKAKLKVDKRKLEADLISRWPRALYVKVTTQMVKDNHRTFGRSYTPWRLIQ